MAFFSIELVVFTGIDLAAVCPPKDFDDDSNLFSGTSGGSRDAI
jgi:hypothetical protein